MDVKATIVSHKQAVDSPSAELHQFVFELGDAENAPIINTISLRTARVLARELVPTTAFSRMVAAIADAEKGSYDRLIGQTFSHA